MKTTDRRYTAPASPPPLVSRPVRAASPIAAPLLCIRCADGLGHASRGLVSFGWGRVALSRARR